MSDDKIKFGIYWAAGCDGCDVAIVDLYERLLDVIDIADIVFWRCATDFKYKDIKVYPHKYIDVCFFNGAIHNSEHEEYAKILRAKSRILIAFGACACFGGIPGLANLTSKKEIFDTVYHDTLSVYNPESVIPMTKSIQEDKYELYLPEFYGNVFALDNEIDVDYYLPGCPPPSELIITAISAIAEDNLPAQGMFIADEKILCAECRDETNREKKDRRSIDRIYKVHEIIPDSTRCLLDQGLIYLGTITRAGCKARCLKANMPCRGCMGAVPTVLDHGAGYIGMLMSILGMDNEQFVSADEIQELVDNIVDYIGTFYRFALPKTQWY